MPTNKPVVSFVISDEELRAVQTYQHENFIKSQSRAILELIKKGLEDFNPVEAFNPEEKEIIRKYRTLDSSGVEAVQSILDIQYRRIQAEDRKKEKNIS